jgi:hypothetical protein
MVLALLASVACGAKQTQLRQAGARAGDVGAAMAQLEAEGLFEKCRQGEMRGCSYFVRLVVYRLNPSGDPSGWGALTKPAGGSNVEGYADDAVALGANATNNVYDLVASSGVPGARPYVNGPLPRRGSDLWEAPRPLSDAQMAYLGGTVTPQPQPQPNPQPNPQPQPQPQPTNLQPVLDRLSALEALVQAMGARVDAARAAAAETLAAMGGLVGQVDRMHQDVLVAIDLGRQMLNQSYTGSNRVIGSLTIRPNRP